MKINEVESLVGITKKNIRFYEQEGLLKPARNKDNGYRDYSEEDVNTLRTIKLLRKLAVPLEEIQQILDEKLELGDCLKRQIFRYEAQEQSIQEMKDLCNSMLMHQSAMGSEELKEYLHRIYRLEEEGHIFVDVKKKDRGRKKRAAVIAASVIILWLGGVLGLFLRMSVSEPVPIGFVLIFVGVGSAVIIGILAALYQRIREIKGGEEDEASKY